MRSDIESETPCLLRYSTSLEKWKCLRKIAERKLRLSEHYDELLKAIDLFIDKMEGIDEKTIKKIYICNIYNSHGFYDAMYHSTETPCTFCIDYSEGCLECPLGGEDDICGIRWIIIRDIMHLILAETDMVWSK